MQQDIINDALFSIKNAERCGKKDCIVKPTSKLLGRVLKVMQEHGYIGNFDYIKDGRGGMYRVELTKQINECGVIKPRFSVGKVDFKKYEERFLPGQDFGVIILTTTKGVMSHYKAKELGIGGKLIAYVY
ncbi:MAG: 30S ribosomal protein S8 [Candidatus Thermoplasmatota archaeon]